MQLQSHFGVYALVTSHDKVLVIKKTLGCYTGLFDLPGGTMEPHELLEETLYREVLEETGCTVTSHRQIGTHSTLYPFKKQGADYTLRHIGAVYHADISGTPRETSDGTDDSGGCLWIKTSELNTQNAAPFVLMAAETFFQK